MLLSASDDQGRGLAEADAIRWHVCPNVDELTDDTIPGVLAEMVDQDMIHLYPDDRGRELYQVIRWWEYQQLAWAQPSRYVAPDGWTDRTRYQAGGEIHKENWEKTGGFDGSGLPSPYVPPTLDDSSGINQLNSTQDKSNQSNQIEDKDSLAAAAPQEPAADADYQMVRQAYLELFPDKPKPRPSNKTLRGKVRTRMKQEHFRENWYTALYRASQSSFVRQSSWFDLGWFLKNDDHYERCFNGNYDDNSRGPPGSPSILDQNLAAIDEVLGHGDT